MLETLLVAGQGFLERQVAVFEGSDSLFDGLKAVFDPGFCCHGAMLPATDEPAIPRPQAVTGHMQMHMLPRPPGTSPLQSCPRTRSVDARAMQSMLDVEVIEHPRTRILALRGMLDGETYTKLDSVVERELAEDDGRHLVFDLSGLDYIASNGIGIFIRSQHQLAQRDRQVVLVRPVASVKEVFNILGLGALFEIADDLTATVNRLEAV